GFSLGLIYGSYQVASGIGGQDFVSGRQLSGSERGLRVVFGLLDAIPAAKGLSLAMEGVPNAQVGKLITGGADELAESTMKVASSVDGEAVKLVDEVVESGGYSNLGGMSFEEGKKYSSWNLLRDEGLSLEQVEKIKGVPKGQKPLPETYLSESYIDNHLDTFKKSGAVKIMSGEPSGTIGSKGGTFVLSGDELSEIIQNADGDLSKIESVLGLDKGYLGSNPVIVTVKDSPSLRIPSGNELGALPEYWEPGGYTSGGIKEAVINPIKEGFYTCEYLFK
ncbi:MAG: hypothetical protein Q4G11_05405, partial [Gallicola sp.]|nr:hypothetical protein [Gallicola sp.]